MLNGGVVHEHAHQIPTKGSIPLLTSFTVCVVLCVYQIMHHHNDKDYIYVMTEITCNDLALQHLYNISRFPNCQHCPMRNSMFSLIFLNTNRYNRQTSFSVVMLCSGCPSMFLGQPRNHFRIHTVFGKELSRPVWNIQLLGFWLVCFIWYTYNRKILWWDCVGNFFWF